MPTPTVPTLTDFDTANNEFIVIKEMLETLCGLGREELEYKPLNVAELQKVRDYFSKI